MQKGFYDFFVVGGTVRGYDFSSSSDSFLIQEDRTADIFPFPSSTMSDPLMSYEVSKTDNEYLLKLEVGYKYESYGHCMVLFVKSLFFLFSLVLFLVGAYLFFSSFRTQYLIVFIPALIILGVMAGIGAGSSLAIAKANSRIVAAVQTLEFGNQIKRF